MSRSTARLQAGFLLVFSLLFASEAVAEPAEEEALWVIEPAAAESPPRLEALQTLHQGNQAQIALAALTLKRSKDPVIRRLARRLLQDHQFLDHRALALADRLQIQIERLTEDADGPSLLQVQTSLLGMQDLQGAGLDQAFLQRVAQGNQQQILHLARLRNALQSDPIRALVDAWIPILQLHLHLSRQLLAPLPLS